MGELLNARADDFVRTTEPRNFRASQAIWERMNACNRDIYLSKYSGWYSVRDEGYFDDSELTDGPNGTKLAPSGAPVEWVEEESYFFSSRLMPRSYWPITKRIPNLSRQRLIVTRSSPS